MARTAKDLYSIKGLVQMKRQGLAWTVKQTRSPCVVTPVADSPEDTLPLPAVRGREATLPPPPAVWGSQGGRVGSPPAVPSLLPVLSATTVKPAVEAVAKRCLLLLGSVGKAGSSSSCLSVAIDLLPLGMDNVAELFAMITL